jgi:glycosyltransferase involved in cell wall biosynthesis
MNNKPLLSFFVSCYNQESFIAEALRGAFSQTYSPLEIVISDDCSSDRTFEIVQEMAREYKGPHKLKLNRNARNLGIGGNVNRAMELCEGELVLLADGDDVSLPPRTEVTFQMWDQFDRKPTSVCLSYMTISAEGKEMGLGGFRGDPKDTRVVMPLEGDLLEFMSTRRPAVCGCSHAWSPELFKYFGPLKSDLEDLVMSFRSLTISQILYIREPLVKYRRHGANVSFFAGGDDHVSFAHRESRLRWVNEQTVRAYDNMLGDIELLHERGRMGMEQRDRLRKEAQRVRGIYAVELGMMEGSFLAKMRTLIGAVWTGNWKPALRFSPRLLPRSVYRALYLSWHRYKARRTTGPMEAATQKAMNSPAVQAKPLKRHSNAEVEVSKS